MAQRTFPSYWMYKDSRDEWRWTYEASNGKTIGVSSEGYKNRSDCRHSIDIMKASANSPVYVPEHLAYAA